MKVVRPKHLILYNQHVAKLSSMPQSAQRVLGYMVDGMNDDNEINLSGYGRKIILDSVGMSPNMLSKSLSGLVKNRILSSPAKGYYIVNPSIYTYKARWGDNLNQQKKFYSSVGYIANGFTIVGDWA